MTPPTCKPTQLCAHEAHKRVWSESRQHRLGSNDCRTGTSRDGLPF